MTNQALNVRAWSAIALTVTIDGLTIGTIDGMVEPTGEWLDGSMRVSDPSLLGILGAEIWFTFDDAAPGTTIHLDDVAFAPVPEPASMILLASGGALSLLRRR